MNLDEIQEMWQRDAVIDPDNLHDESLKIPQLHSKYYTIYNTITLMREKARDQRAKVKLERYNYYTGKADPKVYEEDPFPNYSVNDDKLSILKIGNNNQFTKNLKNEIGYNQVICEVGCGTAQLSNYLALVMK